MNLPSGSKVKCEIAMSKRDEKCLHSSQLKVSPTRFPSHTATGDAGSASGHSATRPPQANSQASCPAMQLCPKRAADPADIHEQAPVWRLFKPWGALVPAGKQLLVTASCHPGPSPRTPACPQTKAGSPCCWVTTCARCIVNIFKI